jgi:hypothetical protein
VTLELNEREQDLLNSLIANQHSDVDFKRMPLSALSTLALGAEVAAKAKTGGISVDALTEQFAERAIKERSRRMMNMPGLAEKILEEAGLGMTEDDLISNNKLAAEESAAYGVGSFEEDVDMRRNADRGFGVGDAERRQMRDIRRKRRQGKPVNQEYEQKVQDRFAKRQGDQVFFDSGLMPFDSVGADDKDGVEMIGVRGASEQQIKDAKRKDREQGVLAKVENDRRFRGDLTEAEMSREARLEAGKVTPEASLDKYGRVPLGETETYKYDKQGNYVGKVETNRTRSAGAGGFVNPDDAQAAILGQLRARKDRGRNGLIEAIAQDAYGKANAEAILGGVRSTRGADAGELIAFPGRTAANIQGKKNVRRLPNVEGLGKARLGQAGARRFNMTPRLDDGQLTGGNIGMRYVDGDNMGVVISQRTPTGTAGMVGRPDGTIYAVDAYSGNLIPGNVEIGPAPKAQELGSYAEQMNAPQMENAARFVAENAYDSYGAQNFGDESILSAMMEDSGSGGGVRQVEITGTLNELDQRLAKKGVVIPDGIRGIADLQAASEQMIAANPKKKFFTRPSGNKMVFSENPGVPEVLEALKYAKFEQEQIANALLQTQLAQATDVNLDAKARYEGGGRMISENRVLGSLTNDGNIVFGVNDPAKGGDSLKIAKAPGKLQQRFREIEGASKDTQKPFVGQIAGAPNRVGNSQVYRGMNPTQVREFYEQQDMENRIKRENRVGKKIVPSRRDEMALVAKIRAAQEGNIAASFNQRQADAVMRTNPTNMLGRIIPGREIPDNLRQMGGPIYAEVYKRQGEQLVQRANNMPVSQRPAAQLLPRPMMPTPSATPQTMGGDPQVSTGPANPLQGPQQVDSRRISGTTQGYPTPDDLKQSMEKTQQQIGDFGRMVYEKGKEFATSNDPTIKRQRRIGYATVGAGGLLGALIGGERNARNEEEQYR